MLPAGEDGKWRELSFSGEPGQKHSGRENGLLGLTDLVWKYKQPLQVMVSPPNLPLWVAGTGVVAAVWPV